MLSQKKKEDCINVQESKDAVESLIVDKPEFKATANKGYCRHIVTLL